MTRNHHHYIQSASASPERNWTHGRPKVNRMSARYPGKCWISGLIIEAGSRIVWDRINRRAALESEYDNNLRRMERERTAQ